MKLTKILDYAPKELINVNYVAGVDEVYVVLMNFLNVCNIYYKNKYEK